MALVFSGGCTCGAVRFELAEVCDAEYCHCNRRRKRTGAPVFAFVIVPRAAVNWLSGKLLAEPAETSGQPMACASCRGPVCFDMGERDLLSFGVGLLDEPARVRPDFSSMRKLQAPLAGN